MSLYDKFIELHKDKHNFYYDEKLGVNPIKSPHRSWEFIKRYFKSGKKDKAFDLKFHNELKRNGKNIHTVSMYYLGLLSKRIIGPNDYELVSRIGDGYYYPFTYIWFLTCLYHDTASVIEEDRNLLGRNLEDALLHLDIEYDVFEYLQKWNIGTQYSEELVKNYYRFKQDQLTETDHGIIGGYLLFDRLMKNYFLNWNEYKKSENRWGTFENFNYKNRLWTQEQLRVFAYISQAIIAHNIWHQNDTDIIREYNLEAIDERHSKRINMNDNLLLYFLGIMDTIEPTKFFKDFDPKDVWNGIEVYIDNECIHLTILDDKFFGLGWFEKIKSLESWICVKVETNDLNNIRIVSDC